jgi:hypothetical protein
MDHTGATEDPITSSVVVVSSAGVRCDETIVATVRRPSTAMAAVKP